MSDIIIPKQKLVEWDQQIISLDYYETLLNDGGLLIHKNQMTVLKIPARMSLEDAQKLATLLSQEGLALGKELDPVFVSMVPDDNMIMGNFLNDLEVELLKSLG